jgi:hypothetical protein
MLFEIFKYILPITIIFSTQVQADLQGETTPTSSSSTVIAPQNHLSDFPNEYISVQARKIKFLYNDIVIPGNGGMDIIVKRIESGDGGKIQEISIKTSNVFASGDSLVSTTCLGDFKRLHINYGGRILSHAGFKSGDIPNSVIAAFDNYSYISCGELDNNQIILHLPNGRKYSFVKVNGYATNYENGSVYKVSKVIDRHSNSIIYEYEDSHFSYLDDRLKVITRNDGQVVNFKYEPGGDLKEITYSGKKVQYSSLNGVRTFTDAAGRQTKYQYGMYTGIGKQITKVTTPEGLIAEYQYNPLRDNGSMRLPTFANGGSRTSFSLSDLGYSGGNLAGKKISGPNIDIRHFQYHNLTGNIGSTKFIAIESNEVNNRKIATVYTIATLSASKNASGQVMNIKRYEGEFILHTFIQNPNENTTLLYQQDNIWTAIESGSVGCISATRIGYALLNCNDTLWEMSSKVLSINNSGEYDNYTSTISSFDTYGQAEVTNEVFGLRGKVTKQSYEHDVENWILNQPRITQIGRTLKTVKNAKEFTYYSKNHVNYPFMPYEFKSFGVWQKKYTQYHTSGDIKKIEYNEKLTFGDKTLNRYQLLENYKRGIARTVTTPGRYSSTPISSTKSVDVNGWVTQEVDFERNVINYGYDNIGRVKYVDPKDDKWSDTLYTWLYNIGSNSNETQQVVSHCTLNSSKTACLSNIKLTSATTFDAKSRPIETIKTDRDNQKSIYQNFIYNHFDRLTFASFPSESLGENSGKAYDYDGIQRLISETVSNGGTQYTNYLSGNRVQVHNFRGKTTTTTYLAYGAPDYSQAVNISSPEGANTTLNVNVYGQVEQITQSGPHKNVIISQTQNNLYDSRQRLCMVDRTDTGNTYYNSNNLGKVNWFAQGVIGNTCSNHGTLSSQKVSLGYDNIGNIHTKKYSDNSPQVTTTLDNNGNVKNLVSGNINQVYEYNSANFLEKETLNFDGKKLALDYEYNSLGHLDSLIYPSLNKIFFAPNAFGQPTKVGSYVTSAQYHPNGQVDTFNYGNGLTYRQTLDDQKRPYNLTVNKGSVSRLSQTYTYDNSNNIEHIYDNTNHYYDIDLGYDDMDRLDYANSNAWGSGSFSYDGLGNLTGKKLGVQHLTYNYNTKKQLSTVTGAVSYNFQYNNDGSVKHNGRYGLTYNRANQLKNANGNSYVYDGNNRLVKKTSSGQATYSFYSLEGTLYHVIPADGNVTEYIYLGDKLVAKELAFKEIDNNPIYKYKPISPTHLGGSATTCSFFTGCSLYISWKHSNANNVTYFELDQRGDSNTGECSKGSVCLDSVDPVKPLKLIKIDNEWVRIYNGKSLFNRPTIKATSADYRVRACNPVGCSSYSPVITVTNDTSI